MNVSYLSRRVGTALVGAVTLVASMLGSIASSPAASADLSQGATLTVLATNLSALGSGALRGLCVDANRNIFFANINLNQIFELSSANNYSSAVAIAGTGGTGPLVAGNALESPVAQPRRLECGADGSIIFSEGINFPGQIGRLLPTSGGYSLSVIAGTGSTGSLVDGGLATDEPLGAVGGLGTTSSGVLYGTDPVNEIVFSLTPGPNGFTFNIIGGTGQPGTPQPGPSTQSAFNNPSDLAIAPDGSLVVSDYVNNAVELLTNANGSWTTSIIANVTAPRGISVDAAGNIYVVSWSGNKVYELINTGSGYSRVRVAGTGTLGRATTGPALLSNLSGPRFLTIDALGNLFLGDTGNGEIEEISPTVTVPATPSVSVATPSASGALTFSWSDANNGGSTITSYAWSGACVGSGNVTSVTCTGLAGGTSQTLFVTATNGVGTSASGSATATALSVPDVPQSVFATSNEDGRSTVFWSAPASDGGSPVTAYQVQYSSDGGNTWSTSSGFGEASSEASDAGLLNTWLCTQYTTVDASDNLYASNRCANTVDKIAPDGTTTVYASVNCPTGLSMASSGVLYVADSCDNTLDVVSSDGSVSTLTSINDPRGVTTLPNGDAVVASSGDNALYQVSLGGEVQTLTPNAQCPSYVAATSDGRVSFQDACDSGLYTVQSDGGTTLLTPDGTACPTSFAESPDGSHYYVGSVCYQGVMVFDATGTLVSVIPGYAHPVGLAVDSTNTLFIPQVNETNLALLPYVGSSVTVDGSTTTATLGGLTNGQAYLVRVLAANVVGWGDASSPFASATPAGVASAPQNVSVSAGLGVLHVSFDAPGNTNGSPVTNYLVTATDTNGNSFSCVAGLGLSSNWTACDVTGLENGIAYDVTVVAYNAAGGSAPADAGLVRTLAVAPNAPSNVVVIAGIRVLHVSFTAPTVDGGSAVTSYLVTATDANGNSFSCVAGPGLSSNSTACDVTGLANGTAYDVTVVAYNVAGGSAPADAGSTTTFAVPNAPRQGVATSNSRTVHLSWMAPANAGDMPITSYAVTDGLGDGCVTTLTTCTISNLVNGRPYHFVVTATSAVGVSPALSFATITPLGVKWSRYIAGFVQFSSALTPAMTAQITHLATLVKESGRTAVTIRGYGDLGSKSPLQLARANAARRVLASALHALGDDGVTITTIAGGATADFGGGLAPANRCVVIATH
jgi:Fibronectin type III domain